MPEAARLDSCGHTSCPHYNYYMINSFAIVTTPIRRLNVTSNCHTYLQGYRKMYIRQEVENLHSPTIRIKVTLSVLNQIYNCDITLLVQIKYQWLQCKQHGYGLKYAPIMCITCLEYTLVVHLRLYLHPCFLPLIHPHKVMHIQHVYSICCILKIIFHHNRNTNNTIVKFLSLNITCMYVRM